MKTHIYETQITWTGNEGAGTKSYSGYRRDHTIQARGRAPILASSDPSFRGDASRYNPEQLLVSALSSCHMLWYLHLCAVNQVRVMDYTDTPTGTMEEAPDGSGAFVSAVLHPVIKVAPGTNLERARALHDDAHRFCFIARSVSFPVTIEPAITFA